MAIPVVITSAQITIQFNNQQYKEVADISFTIDYDESEIFGVDSPYPQEIAGGKITVRGQCNGYRIKLSGGLQGKNLRSLFSNVSATPYVSLLVEDRTTQENIIFIPQCKISSESHSIPNKGTYKLNFSFVGMVPLMALDRA
jgi:hypothetical protein